MRVADERKSSAFLRKHSLEMDVYFVDAKPPSWGGKRSPSGYRYRVVVRPLGSKTDAKGPGVDDFEALCFDYWDSRYNRDVKQPPCKWDILCTLSSESMCGSTFAEFCAELGYSPDSIEAQKAYGVCKAFASDILRILGDEVVEDLQQINR